MERFSGRGNGSSELSTGGGVMGVTGSSVTRYIRMGLSIFLTVCSPRSSNAEVILSSIWSWMAAETYTSLFIDAGFRQVDVTRTQIHVRLPEFEKFVIAHLCGTPIAEAIGSLSASEQSVLARDAAEGLSLYADGVDVVVPRFNNLVFARK